MAKAQWNAEVQSCPLAALCRLLNLVPNIYFLSHTTAQHTADIVIPTWNAVGHAKHFSVVGGGGSRWHTITLLCKLRRNNRRALSATAAQKYVPLNPTPDAPLRHLDPSE